MEQYQLMIWEYQITYDARILDASQFRSCNVFTHYSHKHRYYRIITDWLVHKNAKPGIDYDVDNLSTVWHKTNEQDFKIGEDNQLGIQSQAYEPGHYQQEKNREWMIH